MCKGAFSFWGGILHKQTRCPPNTLGNFFQWMWELVLMRSNTSWCEQTAHPVMALPFIGGWIKKSLSMVKPCDMVRRFKIQNELDISKKSQLDLHQSLRTPISQCAQLHLVLNQPNWNQTEWTNLKNGISLNSEKSASYMPQQLWILGMVRTTSRACIIFLMQMTFHKTKTKPI
jgi:hypothetical protein